MLLRVADKVLVCLDHAAEARELALQESNPDRSAELRDAERRWLRLAESYQLSERIDDFISDVLLRRKSREVNDSDANSSGLI
jgi:hypothetical protein